MMNWKQVSVTSEKFLDLFEYIDAVDSDSSEYHTVVPDKEILIRQKLIAGQRPRLKTFLPFLAKSKKHYLSYESALCCLALDAMANKKVYGQHKGCLLPKGYTKQQCVENLLSYKSGSTDFAKKMSTEAALAILEFFNSCEEKLFKIQKTDPENFNSGSPYDGLRHYPPIDSLYKAYYSFNIPD